MPARNEVLSWAASSSTHFKNLGYTLGAAALADAHSGAGHWVVGGRASE